MEEQTIKEYKNIFEETFKQFQECLKNFKTLNDGNKKKLKLFCDDWEKKLQDDAWLQNFVRIQNFKTILDFKNELSYKLQFTDLLNKVSQHFGEIDCATHLLREFPCKIDNRDISIEKLSENKKSKICDFKINTIEPHFVEVKVVNKLNKLNLEKYTNKALNQIQDSANGYSKYYGVIWIFTYNIPDSPGDTQLMVENIKSSIKKSFNYYLTVQVYSHGLYGDSTFRSIGL